MEAPSGTSWGTVTYGNGYGAKPGIYIKKTETATHVTVTAKIWYWSQYSVQDESNKFYMDWDGYADTSIGSKSINTTSNSGWSTSNQILIGTYTKKYTKTKSRQTGYFSTRFSGIEYGGGTGEDHTVSFTIPALALYTISYDANGGSDAPKSQSYYYGTDSTVSEVIPVKAGYTFTEWNTQKDGNGKTYQPGAKWSGTTANNTTLYAQWEAKEYRISYEPNGGTGEMQPEKAIYGSEYSIKENAFTRDHYSFTEWNTKSDGTGTSHEDTIIVSGDVTLYAQWTADLHEITFDANGGLINEQSKEVQTAAYGDTLAGLPVAVITSGTFIGWNTQKDGTGITYKNTMTVTGDLTLYAMYDPDTSSYMKIEGTYRKGTMFRKKNGVYVKGTKFVKVKEKYEK